MTAHTTRFFMRKRHIKGVMESMDTSAGQLQPAYSCYFRIPGILRSMVCHDSCLEAVCQSAGPQVVPAFPSTNRFKYLCSAVALPSEEASSRVSCGPPSITLSQVPSGILWVDQHILSHLSHWLTSVPFQFLGFTCVLKSWRFVSKGWLLGLRWGLERWVNECMSLLSIKAVT